ncbi:MAG: hypothetical protein AAF802_14025 [Planctomycetota bacterium]
MSSLFDQRRSLAYVIFFSIAILAPDSSPASDQVKAAEVSSDWNSLGGEGVSVSVSGKRLSLALDASVINRGYVVVPRLCAPIRSVGWKGIPVVLDDMKRPIAFQIKPSQQEWKFTWKDAPDGASIIEVAFDTFPVLPKDCPIATPAGDGSVMLHAFEAKTVGEKILFEPQWYKNTVGYWAVDSDYATWDLEVATPGTYSIALLQGCGEGHGGSDARVTLRQGDEVDAELAFQTIDTGHFQNFRWNHLGLITLSGSGKYELRIEATRIASVALFDVRAIHLVPQAKPQKK